MAWDPAGLSDKLNTSIIFLHLLQLPDVPTAAAEMIQQDKGSSLLSHCSPQTAC